MRRNFLMAGLAAAALSVAGCSAHVGNRYNVENVSQLVPGKTTYSEAVSLLGKPVGYQLVPEGREVKWVYSEATVVIVAGRGHGDGVKVLFDKNDVMLRITAQASKDVGV
jgi:outer membrane protein assembly factor BamE (lipoprotein component of BamABCDE complex)